MQGLQVVYQKEKEKNSKSWEPYTCFKCQHAALLSQLERNGVLTEPNCEGFTYEPKEFEIYVTYSEQPSQDFIKKMVASSLCFRG